MNIPHNEKRKATSRKRFKCNRAGSDEVEIFDGGRKHCNSCQRNQCQVLCQSSLNAGLNHEICNKTVRKIEELPMEMLQLILVNAVVEEVKDLKLAQASRMGEAKQIIKRLKKVSYTWSRTVETPYFHSEIERVLQHLAVVSPSLHQVMEMEVNFNSIDPRHIVYIGDRLVIYQHYMGESVKSRSFHLIPYPGSFAVIHFYQLSVIRLVGDSHFETEKEKKYETEWNSVGTAPYINHSSDDSLLVGGENGIIYEINFRNYELLPLRLYKGLKRLTSSNCGKILAIQSTGQECYVNIHSSDFTLLHSVPVLHRFSEYCLDRSFFFNLNLQGNLIFGHTIDEKWNSPNWIHVYEVDKTGQIKMSDTNHLLLPKLHPRWGAGLNHEGHLLVLRPVARFSDELEIYDVKLNLLGSLPAKHYCYVVCGKDNSVILIGLDLVTLYRLNYH